MITDLVQIRLRTEENKRENKRFEKFVEANPREKRHFPRAAEIVEPKIDCRQCGECCRGAEANVSRRDIQRLARFLRLKPSEFTRKYTMKGEGDDTILLRNDNTGCVFLKNKQCSVYEARPMTCRGFPHVSMSPQWVFDRLYSYPERASYCPIVYNWLETSKDLSGFKRSRDNKV